MQLFICLNGSYATDANCCSEKKPGFDESRQKFESYIEAVINSLLNIYNTPFYINSINTKNLTSCENLKMIAFVVSEI